jgi:hypothetical protein
MQFIPKKNDKIVIYYNDEYGMLKGTVKKSDKYMITVQFNVNGKKWDCVYLNDFKS